MADGRRAARRTIPLPINAYAIFLKTSYAWTRKRLGAVAPELAVLDEIAECIRRRGGRDPTRRRGQGRRCCWLVPRTVNGTGHTGPSEFCATSI